jgi:ubiquinone/menaquinone biosynthesis C-methylase UbiE
MAGEPGCWRIYQLDPKSHNCTLPLEHALVLSDENSTSYLMGGFQVAIAFFKDEPKIMSAFQSGAGLDWGEHDINLYQGTERLFRPNYTANLVNVWIPALDSGKIEQKLNKGAKVADVGCGHGISTILMAKAYPNSTFVGFDNHKPSIEIADKKAIQEGLDRDRIHFEVATSTQFPGDNYDFIAFFDCLHDMGDPLGAASHVHHALKADGIWMIVEPFANDRLEDNLNPVSRAFYAGSTLVCVPASLAQNGPALGAQAGEAKLSEIIKSAGFKEPSLAAKTPFNLILEAKP